jgi:gamma-glutamyltranspeptidase/glutathione hydrolase
MSAAARLREQAAVGGPRLVTAAHPAASAAGIGVFAAGGNAFDAALAACFVETIALPMKCGLAGDVVALFRVAHGPLQALVSVGPGPAALAEGATLERLGARSVGIPGAPGGYAALHGFARLGLDALVAPAVRAAERGVPWDRVGLSYLHEAEDLLRRSNGAIPYLPDGRLPAPGELLRLPGLGRLLERFATYGADLFRHEDGDRLLARLDAAGGMLRAEDLAGRPARFAEPCRLELDGAVLYGTPAPSGGARLLPMVSRARREATSLVEIIRQERLAAKALGRHARDGGTSVVTAADADGNAVVIVHSNSFPRFGSGLVLDDGLVLNNRPGRGFDLAAPPGSAAAPAAGRTPPTTLHAWAVERPDGLVMGATPGGINQLPWNLQSVTELLDGAAIGDIVCRPRWALDEQDQLTAEEGAVVPADAGARIVPPVSQRSAQQLLHLPDDGLASAAADPRVACRALALY